MSPFTYLPYDNIGGYDMEHLDDIPLQEEVCIHKILDRDGMKRRLLDLGFVEGCHVTPVLDSPSKGMRAYLIKGCKIALRTIDAQSIFVYHTAN